MMSNWIVNYKYISKKTKHVVNQGSVSVQASNKNEAESKALAELKNHPRVQGTEGFDIEVRA